METACILFNQGCFSAPFLKKMPKIPREKSKYSEIIKLAIILANYACFIARKDKLQLSLKLKVNCIH